MPLITVRFGRGIGTGLLFLGLLGGAALVLIDWETRRLYWTLAAISPMLLNLGFAMTVWPGASYTNREVEARDDGIARWWHDTSRTHVVAWVVAAVLGFGLSIVADAVFGVTGLW